MTHEIFSIKNKLLRMLLLGMITEQIKKGYVFGEFDNYNLYDLDLHYLESPSLFLFLKYVPRTSNAIGIHLIILANHLM